MESPSAVSVQSVSEVVEEVPQDLPPATPAQKRVIRVSFVGFIFIILFSILAGGLWLVKNKQILQQAATTTVVTKVTSVTGVPQKSHKLDELVLNPRAISLGDGKVSNSPKQGYIFSCQTTFPSGKEEDVAPWISDSTWDSAEKVVADGSVLWPKAAFSLTTRENTRIITGNGLPVAGITGVFPISPSDPAYEFDKNANRIIPQNFSFSLPKNPLVDKTPHCVPMGMIGIALNGVPIFNGLDEHGQDAVAHGVQDSCSGRPQSAGVYHYHGPSSCIPGNASPNTLVGYALDGFGIYSAYDADGYDILNSDLDECHGITSEILWDGKKVTMYHYVMTQEYPYTIGCFRGKNITVQN